MAPNNSEVSAVTGSATSSPALLPLQSNTSAAAAKKRGVKVHAPAEVVEDTKTRVAVLPTREPPFTLADIKRSIPAHCFQPTLVESFSHLFLDLVQVAAAVGLVVYLDPLVQSWPVLRLALWLVYWAYQGVTMTGVWVIAHECGHGGFSTSDTINDIVGFVLHTALYVPYFSWQRTHSTHHHYTNNLARDEVFVPARHDGVQPVPKKSERNPIAVFFGLLTILIFGWPLYLLMNASGHASPTFNSHFLPKSSIFLDKDRTKVMLSSLGIIAWTLALYLLGNHFGSLLVFALYLPPLLVTNGFLVAITFLQHTDLSLPHYDEGEWTWLRGALCTVDRTMGRFLDWKLHFIHSTHVCHHIFSRLPFYRAEEATKALIPVLGKFYNKDDSSFALTLYRNFRDCNFIENKKGVLFWVEENLG